MSIETGESSSKHETSPTKDIVSASRRNGVKNELRTLTNVLGRIMNILDKKPSANEVGVCATMSTRIVALTPCSLRSVTLLFWCCVITFMVLIPLLTQGLKLYKDSDYRQFWMPDSSCKECYDCGSKFTTFLRRHHCRICGQIFCSRCCNQEVPGRVIGFQGE